MIDSKNFSIKIEQHLTKIYGEVKTAKEIKKLSSDLQEFIESKAKEKPKKLMSISFRAHRPYFDY